MTSHRASAAEHCGGVDAEATVQVFAFRELKAACGSCHARESCLTLGLDDAATQAFNRLISTRMRVKKRDPLYRPGDGFSALYAVRIGTFKSLVLTEDGREQVTGYHMAGDIVGLDGIGSGLHASQAVALEDGEVCIAPFHAIRELAQDHPALRRNLDRLLSREICREQSMMLLLGSRSADERLALFLLDLADRYRARGYSSSEFVLRMTREEIASYLGLKLETVSRLFSRLQEQGMLQVQGRAIKLLDPSALDRLVRL